MTQARNYSSQTTSTTLSADPGTSGTTLTVADSTVFASLDGLFPWTLLVDWGGAKQEIIDVTARPSGTTLTVTRGRDGTTGQTHAIGTVVQHGVSARDFNEAGAHVGSSSGVHGLTGAVVGTTDTQTLSNKTLSTPTIASFVNATHTHTSSATGGSLPGTSMPTVGVYQSTTLTVNNTVATVLWQAEDWEDNVTADAMHSTSTNNSRLTAPTAGKYLIVGAVRVPLDASFAPYLTLDLRLNGSTTIKSATATGTANKATTVELNAAVKLNANDYVEFRVSSSISGGQSSVTGSANTYASMTMLTV